MYRNKKDIDRHVKDLISKLSRKEFNSRAYSVARLYFEVGDYASCQRYVEQYLSQKDNNAAAHKLLGQAFHKLGQKEKALDEFRTSLDLDPTQTSLILNICELLSEDAVLVDAGRAKYWCEKAEAIFPKHPVTFHLREKLLASEDPDPEAVVTLLTSELEVRPKDPALHARLLKHYLQNNKLKEAFDHSFNVEFNDNTFNNCSAWYETVSEIMKKNPATLKEWQYQLLYLTVRERLCALSLTETPNGSSKSLAESNELLHQFDQALQAVASAGAPSGFAEFHAGLIQHHHGQLTFHIATFFLKKAKKDQLSWREAKKLAAPLMLLSWQSIPQDTKVNWLNHAPDKLVKAVHHWYMEGTYRCSQSGHYILSNTPEKHQLFLDNIAQTCSGKNWKEKYYEKLFFSRDQAAQKRTSFMLSDSFNGPNLRLPRKAEVEAYDIDAQRLYPNSLHHFVWILMNYKNYADFKCTLFDMLTPKSCNYQNCGPETLSKQDVYAFLFSSTLTAQQKNESDFDSTEKPLLPANISDLLCHPSQMKWWDCAYKFSQNTLGTELTDIRVTLSRGIEVVRCIDNHGMDPELLCKLARTFRELAIRTTAVDEKYCLETRAGLYYTSAISMLEKLNNNVCIRIPEKRMFSYTHKELGNKQLNALIEECQLYIAVNHIKESEYDKAIEMLDSLRTPEAYFHLSETYMKIALEKFNISKDANPEVKSKCSTLLSKARNFAYKTQDQLRELQEDPNHPLFSKTQHVIEEIESFVNRHYLDASPTNLNDTDPKYSSDENGSLPGNDYLPVRLNSQALRNLSSTPKQPINRNLSSYRTALESQIFDNTSRVDQKSQEWIERQIKNMQMRESNVTSFIEQTKTWFEENKDLGKIIGTINANLLNTTEQFNQLKISVDQVKSQIDECRSECKDVGELKRQVAELRKEMTKLNKESTEQAVDETDVYSPEDEYRTNDNASTYSAQLPFNTPHAVLPQLNPRFVPPYPIPANPYQLYGQNLYNFYNQYSQFGQGTVPPAPPIFDANRPPHVNFPGIFPTPDQIYPDMGHLLGAPVPVPAAAPAPAPVAVPPPAVAPVIPHVPPMPVLQPAPQPPVSIPKTVAPIQTKESSQSLPVNVVITSSDPLPTCNTGPQPVLSVTIPTKHIKGTPHNYQIALPAASENQVTPPSIFTSNVLGNTTPSKPFTNWSQTIDFKSTVNSLDSKENTPNAKFSLFDTLKTPNTSISGVDGAISSPNTSLNKSRTLSEKSNTSVDNYDPCPDFKPIVPLPAEVKVTTGEEDETTLFSARAKLFRFVDKQWKERGLGVIKLLKHKVTEKVRVLMRREQVHKVCANHIITPEMEIKQMKNESKAYFWVANDYADEAVVLEKFCARFKTAEVAKDFYETFESARKSTNMIMSDDSKSKPDDETRPVKTSNETSISKKESNLNSAADQGSKTVVGGFTFNSTPNFKVIKDEKPEAKAIEASTSTANPFNSVSLKTNTSLPFGGLFKLASETSSSNITPQTPESNNTPTKLNNSDTVEDYEPTIDFKPVVPLPALVETKTGEEDENILFEHRAKLLRFDASAKEWKERGLGNIKLLAQKDNPQKIRLLMRREQVMKVCCNHAITKELNFGKMPNIDKAVTWCAKDFSEGELVPETFCLRFKTVDACDRFLDAIKAAQSSLKDESKAAKEEKNAAKQTTQSGFGDKFRPKPGSWQCNACYTNNLESFTKCACCEQPNPNPVSIQNTVTTTLSSNWGDKFKPKAGSWECKECLIRNDALKEICSACNSPKDPAAVKNTKPVAVPTSFSFGIPKTAQPAETPAPTKESTAAGGWGDKFKPKEGSWECKNCLVINDIKADQCCACNSPKDPNAVKKESYSIFDSIASGPKFSFGIKSSTPAEAKPISTPPASTIFDGTGGSKFTFGIPATAATTGINITNNTGVIYAAPAKLQGQSMPINFSINKIGDSTVTVKPALLQTPQKESSTAFGKEPSGKFDFVFKQKTPTSVKSPKSDKADESDGNEYASEDEGHHIHFSPVIPMPDKVEVVTGEENEDELYGHRAKLFRFTKGEWKERGIGVVKILKHKVTGKLRVVMRREQVLKICLNHALTSDIMYTNKDDKTWLFAANDFSEGELTMSQFCLRFKSKEIAQQFKDALDKALGGESMESQSKDSDSDDVVFVSEIQATSEEKDRAKELMLPENFYTYKNKESCQGCRGCEQEDAPASAAAAPTAATPVKTPAFNSPLFSTPANLNNSSNTSIYRTPLDTIRSNKITPHDVFSNINVTNSEKDKENSNAGSKFFNFGQTNLVFGSNPDTSSVFGATNFDSPITTKSSILAAPKITAFNMSKENNASETKSDPKSLFGSAQAKLSFEVTSTSENKSIFAAPTTAASIFPNAGSKPVFGGTIFGNAAPGTSLFGTNNKDDGKKSEVKSIFGGDTLGKSDNIFSSNSKGSIFGPGSTKDIPSTGSIFGKKDGSIFGSNAAPSFGASKPVFGNSSETNWSFGGKQDQSNAKAEAAVIPAPASATKPNDTAEETASKETLFSVDNKLSFAALSSAGVGFKPKADFQWEGAGATLFGAKPKDASKNESGADDTAASAEDEEYDPHYEPIVPLPDKITVTTGEEDEEKVFGERCKLYRFDEKSREWKERGVGELKLLHHPARCSYRLLLRREQVYKAVLNMLLFPDLELLPMKNSDRAWTWVGRNFAENAAGEQEMLAVRFKSVALATAFNENVVECVRKLQAAAAQAIREEKEGKQQSNEESVGRVAPLRLPKHLSENARADFSGPQAVTEFMKAGTPNGNDDSADAAQADDEEEYDHNYDEDDYYEGYYNEEESTCFASESSVMISRGDDGEQQNCDSAQVQVMYDQELDAPKVLVSDANTGEVLADMIIHTETEFQINDDTCSWSGTDYTTNEPEDKTVTATFSNADTAMQFYDSCETSKAATYSSADPEGCGEPVEKSL